VGGGSIEDSASTSPARFRCWGGAGAKDAQGFPAVAPTAFPAPRCLSVRKATEPNGDRLASGPRSLIQEAARRFDVSTMTIRAWIENDQLESFRVERDRRIYVDAG
jgi:excisionase family DNA binding protein